MQVQPDSYRYINWILFILASSVNGIPNQSFSGVTPIIQQLYQISQFEANAASFFYPISYIFVLIPINYLIESKGLKISTLVCQGGMILGLLTKLLINVNFYLFYLGTFMCSLVYCIMISGANKFANTWFPQRQIFLVSSICIFAIFTSDAIGTFLSSYFIRKTSTKDDVFTFFLWESIPIIIIHLLMVIFFRGKPKNIQNYASAAQRNSFKQDLKALLHNKNYKIIFGCMSFVFGDIVLIFIFLPWIAKPYGFGSQFIGFLIVFVNLAGCLGSVLIGIFGKAFSYKKKIIYLCLGACVFLGLIWVSLQVGSTTLAYISGGLTGFTIYPLLSTLADFSTQTTFPVGEATASGILFFGGQFSGILLSIIFSFIFNGQSIEQTRILNAILMILVLLGGVTIFFSKQILKRDQYENEKQRQSLLQHQSNTLN